ncbi:hypothetical protein [Chlamydiifrater volucris]|uniref:hypothetical protein n=1 Tax=Chlamydiifrater volucris TaxID=2681470 RepID=UPI001BCE9EB0|nr:hypothetical protein [Chlamydiifrater volucris]
MQSHILSRPSFPPSQIPPPLSLTESSQKEDPSARPLWKKIAIFVLTVLFHIITLGVFLIIDCFCKREIVTPPETPFPLPSPQIIDPLKLPKFFPKIPSQSVPIPPSQPRPTYEPALPLPIPAIVRPSAWKLHDSLLDLYKKQENNEIPRAARPFLDTVFGPKDNPHFVNSYPVYLMKSFLDVGLIDRFLADPENPGEEWLFPKIVDQICYLDNRYFLINVSGDGTCFYRSFAIGWFVSLISNPENPKALRKEICRLESLPFATSSERNAILTRRVVAILKLCFRKRKLSFLFDQIFLSAPMTDVIEYLRELSYFSAAQKRKSTMTEADAKQLILTQLNDDPSYLQQALTTLSEFSPCSSSIQSLFYSPDMLLNTSTMDPCDELFLMCRFFKKIALSTHKEVAPLARALGKALNIILDKTLETQIKTKWPSLFVNVPASAAYRQLKQNTPYLSDFSRLYLHLETLPASSFDPKIEAFLTQIHSHIKTYGKSKQSLKELLFLQDSIEHKFYEVKDRLLHSLFRKDFALRATNALLTTISTSISHSEYSRKIIQNFVALLNSNFQSLYEANREMIQIQQQELLTEEYLLSSSPTSIEAEQELKEDFSSLLKTLNIKNLDPLVIDFLFLINSPQRAEKVLKSYRSAALLNTFSYLYNSTAAELLDEKDFKATLTKASFQLCLTQRYSSNDEILFSLLRIDSDEATILRAAFSHPEFVYSLGCKELLQSCWSVLAEANQMATRLILSLNSEHRNKLELYKDSLKVLSLKEGDVQIRDNVLQDINESSLLYAFLLNHPGVVDEDQNAMVFLGICKRLCNADHSALQLSLPSRAVRNNLSKKRLAEAIYFQKVFIQNPLYKKLLEDLLLSMPLDELDRAFRHSITQAETEHVASLSREISSFAICQFLGTNEAISPYNFSLDLADQVSLLTETQGFVSLYAAEEEASVRLLRLSNHYCCLLPIEKEESEETKASNTDKKL